MTALVVLGGMFCIGVWCILVAGANLNAYPAPSQESNDYGEKHRTS